jgi:hypothetical protein
MLRKFRNRSEYEMQRQIRTAIERHGVELHEKVRIADLIDISRLDQRGLGSYALESHFDFALIGENQEAIVALEFDGPGHNSYNDAKKNSICQQANLPLIRVYNFTQVREIKKFTLVQYIVELVLHARIFLLMQKEGTILPDEPFVLSGFLKSTAKHIFDSEFDFIGPTNGKLTRALQKSGLAADSLPYLSISHLVVVAPDGIHRAFISINSSKGPIVGSATLRVTLPSRGFLANIWTVSGEISQFAVAMAADDLLYNIHLTADGHGHVVTSDYEVVTEIKTLKSLGYTLVMGRGSGCNAVDLFEAFSGGRAG